MQFIIMDLEWNNAYCKKLKGYINEIIEFGACKVDKDFNVFGNCKSTGRKEATG